MGIDLGRLLGATHEMIDASDPKFDETNTADLLRSLGAVAVEPFED